MTRDSDSDPFRPVKGRLKREESVLRRNKILELVAQGLPQSEVASRVGVTRAWVNKVVLDDIRGVTAPTKTPKGPPNAEERAKLVATLKGPPATAGFPDEEYWDTRLAKQWYRKHFGRMIRISDLETIIRAENLPCQMRWHRQLSIPQVVEREQSPDPRTGGIPRAKLPEFSVKGFQKALGVDEETARELVRNTLVQKKPEKKPAPAQPAPVAKKAPAAKGAKLGRNDPCPANAALKFKNCCGARGLKVCDGLGREGRPKLA